MHSVCVRVCVYVGGWGVAPGTRWVGGASLLVLGGREEEEEEAGGGGGPHETNL